MYVNVCMHLCILKWKLLMSLFEHLEPSPSQLWTIPLALCNSGPVGKNVYSSTLIKHMCRGCMRHVNVVLFLQQMKRSGRKLWVSSPLPEIIPTAFLPWSQSLLSWLLYFTKTKWHGSFPQPPNGLFLSLLPWRQCSSVVDLPEALHDSQFKM